MAKKAAPAKKVLNIVFEDPLLSELQEAAAKYGLQLASFIRMLVIEALEARKKPKG